jgi:hypothetical protein
MAGNKPLNLDSRSQLLDFLPVLREILDKSHGGQVVFGINIINFSIYIEPEKLQEIFKKGEE